MCTGEINHTRKIYVMQHAKSITQLFLIGHTQLAFLVGKDNMEYQVAS